MQKFYCGRDKRNTRIKMVYSLERERERERESERVKERERQRNSFTVNAENDKDEKIGETICD